MSLSRSGLLRAVAVIFLLVQASCTVQLWEGGSGVRYLRGEAVMTDTGLLPDNSLLFEFSLIAGKEELKARFDSKRIQFRLSCPNQDIPKEHRLPIVIDSTTPRVQITDLELESGSASGSSPKHGAIGVKGCLGPATSHGKVSFRTREQLSNAEQHRISRLSSSVNQKDISFSFLDRGGESFSWTTPEELVGRWPISVALHFSLQEQSSCFVLPLQILDSGDLVTLELDQQGTLSWSTSLRGEWTESMSDTSSKARVREEIESVRCPLTLTVPYTRSVGGILWRIPASLITIPFDIVVGGTVLLVVILPYTLITGEWPGH